MRRSTFIILFVTLALAIFAPLIAAFPFPDRSILRRCFGSLCGTCGATLFGFGGCNGSPVGLGGVQGGVQGGEQSEGNDDESGASPSSNDASSITLNDNNSVEIAQPVETSEDQTGDELGGDQGVALPIENNIRIGQPETSEDQTGDESDATMTNSELLQARKRGFTSISIPEGDDGTSSVDVSNNNQVYVNGIPVSTEDVSQIPSEEATQPTESDADSETENVNVGAARAQSSKKRWFGSGWSGWCGGQGQDQPQSPQSDQSPEQSPSSNVASSITLNNGNTVQIGQPENSEDQTGPESDSVYVNGIPVSAEDVSQTPSEEATQTLSEPTESDTDSQTEDVNGGAAGAQSSKKRWFGSGWSGGCGGQGQDQSQAPQSDQSPEQPQESEPTGQNDHTIEVDNNNNIQIQTPDQATIGAAGAQPSKKRWFGSGWPGWCGGPGQDQSQSPQSAEQPQEYEPTVQNAHTIVVDNNNNIQIQTTDQATVTAFETYIAEATQTINVAQDVPFTIFNTVTEYYSITIDNTVIETATVTQVMPMTVLAQPQASIVVLAPSEDAIPAAAPVCASDYGDAIPAAAPVSLSQCDDAAPVAVDSSYVPQQSLYGEE